MCQEAEDSNEVGLRRKNGTNRLASYEKDIQKDAVFLHTVLRENVRADGKEEKVPE